jgi:hypothetical protein
LGFTVVTCALAPLAYMTMFSGFTPYDDEGSFLITLRDYLAGQSLYTQVFSIYGPLYYEVMGGLFKVLGVGPGHDSGRFVTLAIWLIGSLAAGLGAYRLTHSPWLGLSAQLVTFHVLVSLVSEPMHPAGLASLLLVCMAFAAGLRSGRPRSTAAVIGGIVGALLLIKINIGAFAAIAVAFAFAVSLSPPRRRLLLPLMVLVVAVLPLALMAGLLNLGWVFEFALLVTFSGVAVGVACLATRPRSLPPGSLGWLAAGGATVVLITLAVTFAGGTRPTDLFNGLVVVAWRLPRLFVVPVRIGPFHVLWAGFSLAGAIAILVLRVRVGSDRAAGLVRVAVGFLTWLSVLFLPSSLFLLTLPLAWLATLPPKLDAANPVDGYARTLLPALAVLESLQAYPVAGTQMSLAALMLVPVGAITFSDGIRQLRAGAGEASRPAPWLVTRAGPWLVTRAAPAALLVSIAATELFGLLGVASYATGTPLGLSGAESVRVPAQRGADLRGLVAAIDRECSTFITYPGMTSFYLWTRQPPPVPLYAGVWMFVSDSQAQQSLVDELTGMPRLCVVKNQSMIDFWSQGRPVPDRPLVDYIDSGFVGAASFGDYQLLVRP